MTFADWFERYRALSGDPCAAEPVENFVFSEEKGFITYDFEPNERILYIIKVCGDVRYWAEVIRAILRETRQAGVIGVRFFSTRPKPIIRLFGGSCAYEGDDAGRGLYAVTIPIDEALRGDANGQ